MQTSTHPNQDQPKCINCKHFAASVPWSHRQIDRCHHPKNGVDLVRGLPLAPSCELLRDMPAKCGEQGQWFEASSDCESTSTAEVKP